MSTQPEGDDRDPMDVLYNIEKQVCSETVDSERLPSKPRWIPDNGTIASKVLRELGAQESLASSEMRATGEKDTTRPLTHLYRAYLVDREQIDGVYHYTITEVGELALDKLEEKSKQTNLNSSSPNRPWVGSGVGKNIYYVLKCVSEADDAPRSTDISEKFADLSGATVQEQTPTASPTLSKAYRDGLVDRTPSQPYRYWLTDDGKEILLDAE